jgi:hypothetical protein
MRINEIAAIIHADMVNDDRNGYDWDERYGGPEVKTLVIDGREYSYHLGDRDCSSSTTEAWQLAVQYTPYEGTLDGATYTGNILSVFLASGLFDKWPVGEMEEGDLLLNYSNHVAMYQGDWTLSEFSGNEWGGVYGGQRGDQTGWEGHMGGYYDYPWNCVVHYNGAADEYLEGEEMYPVIVPPAGAPVYRLYKDGEHFFTVSEAERDGIVGSGWTYEGVAWRCPDPRVPVYRMYNPRVNRHFFTASFEEASNLKGWRCEAVAFFGAESGQPVHRLYNPETFDHLLTVNDEEARVVQNAGYVYEGVAFYV